MEPFNLPSPRITAIELPAIDVQSEDKVLIRVELDQAPIDAWLDLFRAALAVSSEKLRQAAPRLVTGRIEFDSAPTDARGLCEELRILVDMTTQQSLFASGFTESGKHDDGGQPHHHRGKPSEPF